VFQIKDVLLQMRDIGCDWIDRSRQINDYQENTKEKLLQVNRDFPRRAVAPSLTQMHLIRRMMHTIFSPDAPGMQGGLFSGEKDLKKEWLPVWEEFYRNSYYFPFLLQFPATLRELTDLSALWFREFYLEITKEIQFPISQSMPWLLTEFMIQTPTMKEVRKQTTKYNHTKKECPWGRCLTHKLTVCFPSACVVLFACVSRTCFMRWTSTTTPPRRRCTCSSSSFCTTRSKPN
jgi:hypothetical protein